MVSREVLELPRAKALLFNRAKIMHEISLQCIANNCLEEIGIDTFTGKAQAK